MPNTIDIISIVLFVATIGIFFYLIIRYHRGMKTPPFWMYIIAGFIFITLRDVLVSAADIFPQNELVLSLIRFLGQLSMLIGVILLLKSFTSRIKFDKKQS